MTNESFRVSLCCGSSGFTDVNAHLVRFVFFNCYLIGSETLEINPLNPVSVCSGFALQTFSLTVGSFVSIKTIKDLYLNTTNLAEGEKHNYKIILKKTN